MRIWLWFSILLTSYLCSAQEYTLSGYIIYKNGDTIRTRIAVTGSFSTGVFDEQMMKEVKTISSNNQVRIYLAWDLLGYGFSKAD